MSIIETKFRKGYVETPVLNTDNIVYMGHDLPLYDTTSQVFITEPKNYEKEVGIVSSGTYTSGSYSNLRFLPHSSLLNESKLITLTGISLYMNGRSSSLAENDFFVLCIFSLVNGNYVFLGSSQNAFVNPRNATLTNFDFNLKLFEEITNDDNTISSLPYSQIFVKFLKVDVAEDGKIETILTNITWNNDNFISMNLQGCPSSNYVDFNPHFTTLNGDFSPHGIIKFQTGNYTANQKIPHNLNGDVHVTREEKEKIENLTQLTNQLYLSGDEYANLQIVDTNEGNGSSSSDTFCSIIINPEDFINKYLYQLLIKNASGSYVITNKFLQADCYDENGILIDTFYSKIPSSQVNNETLFIFDDFKIIETYKKIKFKLSNQNTQRQENYLSFVAKTISNKTEGRFTKNKGWYIEWLQGAPASGNESLIRIPEDRTVDIQLVFCDKVVIGDSIVKHMIDQNLHLVEDERRVLDEVKNVIAHESGVTTFNSKVLANAPNLGNQSVTAFHLGCDDIRENTIKSVTIIRNDNTNLASDFFLYADCYDGNNVLLKTIFTSSEAQTQTSTSGYETKFEFQDFVIEKNFKKIIFKATKEKGVRQNEKFRIGCLQTSNGSNILYKDWKTEWNNAQVQNFTSYFEFDLVSTKYTFEKYNEHIDDTTIHLSEEQKEKLAKLDEIDGMWEIIRQLQGEIEDLKNNSK